MTPDERKQYLKTPVEIVVTRSFKGKKSADSKLEEFAVGEVVSMTHEFADEAISLGKAVLKDSPQHKAFVAAEAKKKKSSEATKTVSIQDAVAQLVGKLDELIDALKPKK